MASDLSLHIEAVARHLLGEPNRALSARDQWRSGGRRLMHAVQIIIAALIADPGLGVRDRIFVVTLAHRARLGLAISDADVSRLLALHRRRGHETAAMARVYAA